MTLTIKINLDNAAFKHDDGSLDYGTVSETVYIVSKWVESGESLEVLEMAMVTLSVSSKSKRAIMTCTCDRHTYPQYGHYCYIHGRCVACSPETPRKETRHEFLNRLERAALKETNI